MKYLYLYTTNISRSKYSLKRTCSSHVVRRACLYCNDNIVSVGPYK